MFLDTRMASMDAKLTEEQCLARTKTAIGDLLKGNKNVTYKQGQHTYSAASPDLVLQVECLQSNKVSGAYIVAAAATGSSATTDTLSNVTSAIDKALKAP